MTSCDELIENCEDYLYVYSVIHYKAEKSTTDLWIYFEIIITIALISHKNGKQLPSRLVQAQFTEEIVQNDVCRSTKHEIHLLCVSGARVMHIKSRINPANKNQCTTETKVRPKFRFGFGSANFKSFGRNTYSKIIAKFRIKMTKN